MQKKQDNTDIQNVGWAFRLTIILIVGIAILLLAIPAPSTTGKPKVQTFGGGQNSLVGKPAPDFAQRSLKGELLSLENLRGQPFVINFWATWCAPCKVEHPVLQNVAAEYASKGISFVGVIHLDSMAEAQKFLAKEGQNYPMIMDYNSVISKSYKVQGVPHTFVVNQHGTIVFSYPGSITNEQVLRDVLDTI